MRNYIADCHRHVYQINSAAASTANGIGRWSVRMDPRGACMRTTGKWSCPITLSSSSSSSTSSFHSKYRKFSREPFWLHWHCHAFWLNGNASCILAAHNGTGDDLISPSLSSAPSLPRRIPPLTTDSPLLCRSSTSPTVTDFAAANGQIIRCLIISVISCRRIVEKKHQIVSAYKFHSSIYFIDFYALHH